MLHHSSTNSSSNDFEDEEEKYLFEKESVLNPDWLINDCKDSKKNSDNDKLYVIENKKNKLQLFSNKVPVLKFQLKQDEINLKTITGYRNFVKEDLRKFINLSKITPIVQPSVPLESRQSRKSSPRSSVGIKKGVIISNDEPYLTQEEEKIKEKEIENENLLTNPLNEFFLNKCENSSSNEVIINIENIDLEKTAILKLKEDSTKLLMSSMYLSIFNYKIYKSYILNLALYKFMRKRSTRILRKHATSFLLNKRKKLFSIAIPIQLIIKIKRIKKKIAVKQIVKFLVDCRKYGSGGIGNIFSILIIFL